MKGRQSCGDEPGAVLGPGGLNEGAGGGLCGRRVGVCSGQVCYSRRAGGSGSAGSRASQAEMTGASVTVCIDETDRASMEFIRVQCFGRGEAGQAEWH